MALDTSQTVASLAITRPASTGVLEGLGIDYCCGGSRSIAEACASAGIAPEELDKRLAEAESRTAPAGLVTDWTKRGLQALVTHIVNAHHAYLYKELPRLAGLFDKVMEAHGKNHPELDAMYEQFSELQDELMSHMFKEEHMLFPYITRLDTAAEWSEVVERPPFGSVRFPIRMMVAEHDSAGEALQNLRTTSRNYAVPPDGCPTFHALYAGLKEMEADLHQHIHLENNILFPRAVELEERATMA
jgi:regulator of cell morphogenesis and NO signaling